MKKDKNTPKKTPPTPPGSSSEKITPGTKNLVEDAKEKLLSLFPECATEASDAEGGKKTIDLGKLRELLAPEALDDNGPAVERYEFTWPGKRAAIKEAFRPVAKTLRPDRGSSLNFDSTANLYIEGDNLDALKILQNAYLGKVKMIYIDPPYNTGNDFIYNDNFKASREALDVKDADGNVAFSPLSKNSQENPHYHSDWCSMIYPRLKLARNLLGDDGVIFISIDDNEVHNLRKICDEIFGEGNFVAQVVWERAYAPINLMKHFSPAHDYILCYARNLEMTICNGILRSEEANNRYSNPDNDPRGVWMSSDISVGPAVDANIYPITTPSGRVVEPPAGRSWSLSKKAFSERLRDNRIWFGEDGDGVPRIKRFLSDLRKAGVTPMTLWKYTEVGHSQDATKALMNLFNGKKFFDYPKPVKLIERCLQLYSARDSLVLDFFSGSATTAHAVMQLNAEDGGNRRFIMVQWPEACKKGSEAADSGFENICEIGKERIRHAGTKIKDDMRAEIERRQTAVEKLKTQLDALREKSAECALVPDATLAEKIASAENELETAEAAFEQKRAALENLDTGFRVLKVDETPEKDVSATASETRQAEGQGLYQQNFKDVVTEEDLLFFALLQKTKITLDDKIELRTLCGNRRVYFVAGTALVACFDADGNVDEELIRAIAEYQPAIAVFRDAGFKDDPAKINAEQIFKQLSPDTKILTL